MLKSANTFLYFPWNKFNTTRLPLWYWIYFRRITNMYLYFSVENKDLTLQWHHNGRNGISNHQPHDCFLNHLFRRRSKKTSKICITGLCAGIFTGDRHKWPVTRKMFPFDDVIMTCTCWEELSWHSTDIDMPFHMPFHWYCVVSLLAAMALAIS